MRNKPLNLIFLAVVLCASPVWAQQSTNATVYIANATTSESLDADQQKIAQAIGPVLELRLNSIKGIQVVRGVPKCEAQSAVATQSTNSYVVNTSVQSSTRTGPSNNSIVELVLGYELLKLSVDYDQQKNIRCMGASVIHRSEPISVKTAFGVVVQMGNILDAAIAQDSGDKKIVVDVLEVTGAAELSQLKDQLAIAILSKLTDEDNLEARSFGAQPGSDSDYVVRGELIKGPQSGAKFHVQNVKTGKFSDFNVRGPVAGNNSDSKALSLFFETAASAVLSFIRGDQHPGNLTDADVSFILTTATSLLCESKPVRSDCVPQTALVIPDLLRLKDSNRATPETLGLLGDAYAIQEDYDKAVGAYDDAVTKPGNVSRAATLSFQLRAAESSYKAQQYLGAAVRYDHVIERAPTDDPTLLTPTLFVQATRSYRFARDLLKALYKAVDGKKRFPDSADLDVEIMDTIIEMSGSTLLTAYETLLTYKDVAPAAEVAAHVKSKLVAESLDRTMGLFIDHKYREAKEYLDLVERLNVDSLTPEAQAAYRVERAVLQRETGSDIGSVIATLEPYAKQETRFTFLARYFLAETLYKRARTTAAPDKADYVRASMLLGQIANQFPQDFVFQLLVKTNHEIAKDQETREYLEQLIGRGQSVTDAQTALAMLCTDYIGDLVCGQRIITEIGPPEQLNRETLLRLGSIYTFWARYSEANKLLVPVAGDPNRPLLEVELFYRVWIALAITNPDNAQALFEAWRRVMEGMRAAGDTTDWSFTPAYKALDADQALRLPQYKPLLRRMLAAMNDPKQPLPNFMLVAPATGR